MSCAHGFTCESEDRKRNRPDEQGKRDKPEILPLKPVCTGLTYQVETIKKQSNNAFCFVSCYVVLQLKLVVCIVYVTAALFCGVVDSNCLSGCLTFITCELCCSCVRIGSLRQSQINGKQE